MDRFSSQFVASLPYLNDVIGNAELPECYAMYYGLPSPACVGFVGRPLRGKPLDKFGNLLTTTPLGDNYRERHDALKWLLDRLFRQANIEN